MDQSLNILFIYKKKYHKKNKLVVSASKIKIWRYNIYQLSITPIREIEFADKSSNATRDNLTSKVFLDVSTMFKIVFPNPRTIYQPFYKRLKSSNLLNSCQTSSLSRNFKS